MSRGKYSPALPHKTDFSFNALGQRPAPYSGFPADWDEKTMFANYDDEGFDQYGYSAFAADGTFVGLGQGVDRVGKTEHDYLCMDDAEWEDALEAAHWI